MIKVEHAAVFDLSVEDFRKCRRLGFRKNGCIKHDLMAIRAEGCKSSLAVMVKDETDKVLSWALVDRRHMKRPLMQIYTRYRARRKGYGRIVTNRVVDLVGTPHTLPHDPRSLTFFKAVGVRQ